VVNSLPNSNQILKTGHSRLHGIRRQYNSTCNVNGKPHIMDAGGRSKFRLWYKFCDRGSHCLWRRYTCEQVTAILFGIEWRTVNLRETYSSLALFSIQRTVRPFYFNYFHAVSAYKNDAQCDDIPAKRVLSFFYVYFDDCKLSQWVMTYKMWILPMLNSPGSTPVLSGGNM